MRRRTNRLAGVVALVATLGAAVAAFQIDPDVVTQVVSSPTGLWIPAPSTGEIVRVDAASGDITARVVVGEPGAEFVVDEQVSGVVVVDRTAGRVALVDPALNEVIREVRTVVTSESLVDIGPGVVVAASGSQVDLIDLDVTGTTSTQVSGATRSVAADGGGAISETLGGRFDIAADGSVEGGSGSDGSGSRGMVVRVIDRVVVASGSEVRNLDGSKQGCFDGNVMNPSHLVGTDDNWVIAIEGSVVHVSDLGNGECVAVDLGEVGGLGRPVVANRRVFVPERRSGIVHMIEPSQGVVRSHYVLGEGGDLRMRARNNFVVAYDAGTPIAALMDEDGVIQFVDTSIGHSGISAVIGEDASAAVVDEGEAGVLDGVDGISTNGDAPIIDAGVLASTLQNPLDDTETPLPTGELVANFAFSASTVTVGEAVRFIDGSTGGPESWLWDFGDGTGAEGPEVEKSWDDAGTYPVALRVSRGAAIAEISLAITVVPAEVPLPPAADFVFSSTVVNAGKPVSFEDRSDGEIDRWRWDFGDGTSSTDVDVTKSWASPGRYVVQLTVANDQGSDSAAVLIEVVDGLSPPLAVISATETEVDLGAPLTFRGASSTDPAAFIWDFGDGRISSGAEVVHVFLKEGVFTVTLTAKNDAGTSTAEIDITVAPPTQPPTALIGTLPEVIEVGVQVTLNSLSSNAPKTEQWSFGDGDSASGRVVTHIWTTPGTYLLAMTAANSAGTNTATELIEVVDELPTPTAQVGSYDESPRVGDATVFVDASIAATSWLWDFGDGVTSNAPNPLHTFTSAGQKVVTLTVTNRNGADSTAVIVEPRLKPDASFFASSTAIRAGETVAFTDASVNAVSWFWNFGDLDDSGSQHPTHTYAEPGAYAVSLTVESATGDIDTFGPVVINVDPAPPLVDRILKVPVNTGGLTTLVLDTFEAQIAAASGPIDLYQIDFGDGSAILDGVSPRFSHAFGASGTYVVQMRAHGPLGEWSDWASRTITVVDPPAPIIAIADSVPATAQVGSVTLTGVELSGSGPIESWRWAVSWGGNLSEYSSKVAAHNFETAGVYTLTLIAESPVAAVADGIASRTITITIPDPPVINSIAANPATPTTAVQVTFTPDFAGSVTKWEWDYEGGGYIPGREIGSHVFNTPGIHEIYLRVTGPFGRQDVERIELRVNPKPEPTPPVALPSDTVETGTLVNLSSTEVNGRTGLRWDWTISSGAVAISYPDAGQSVDHLFDIAGSWTVTVTATDALGIFGSAVNFVTVADPTPPLVANFSPTVAGPLQTQFNDTSSGPAADTWSWDFDDPGAVGDASAANPVVTFSAAGSYNVTLRVSSGAEVDQVTILVTVA
ncbi:MAG: PKD repeat protein [Candidatus Aldehydirespiratoraceae bacterium]|jgi:PKD repeat protein